MIFAIAIMMLFSSCKQKNYKVYQVFVEDSDVEDSDFLVISKTKDEVIPKIEKVLKGSSYTITELDRFPEYTITTEIIRLD